MNASSGGPPEEVITAYLRLETENGGLELLLV